MTGLRVAIYARVSSEEQADRQLPIDGQIADCRDHAAKHGWTVVGEFVDAGISGTRRDRPELLNALEGAREGKFNILLAWDSSRIARDTPMFGWATVELEQAGVSLEFVQASGASPLERDIRAVLSAEQIRQMRAATKRGMLRNADRRGRHGSRDLFGYRWVDKYTREIVPEEAEIVRWIFDAVEQRTPISRIRERTGFDDQRISWILTHAAYAGAHTYGRRPAPEGRRGKVLGPDKYRKQWGAWEPIVPREQWERVQEIRAGHRRRPNGGSVALSGLLHCEQCNRRLRLTGWDQLKAGRKFKYECPSCGRRIRALNWTASIVRSLADYLGAHADELVRELRRQTPEAPAGDARMLAASVARLARERGRLIDLYASGKITGLDAVAEKIEAVERELAARQADLEATKKRTLPAAPSEAEVLAQLEKIASQAEALTGDSRVDYIARPLLHAALERIDLNLDTRQGALVISETKHDRGPLIIPSFRIAWSPTEVAA